MAYQSDVSSALFDLIEMIRDFISFIFSLEIEQNVSIGGLIISLFIIYVVFQVFNSFSKSQRGSGSEVKSEK